MSRVYSVAIQSRSLPIGFRIATIPEQKGTHEERLRRLGFIMQETSQPTEGAANLLVMLISFELQHGGPASRKNKISPILESNATELLTFVESVAAQQIVPVESSPMHGASIESLAKRASIVGFATYNESVGMAHHDPFLIILTPFMTVIIGAAVGASEGVKDRVEHVLASPASCKKKSKKKS